jgi:hypothetical protein
MMVGEELHENINEHTLQTLFDNSEGGE